VTRGARRVTRSAQQAGPRLELRDYSKEGGMFAEGSVYSEPREDDGVRCLVMRRWPRGVVYERVDVWLKELGPTTAQLHGLESGGLNWATFAAAYLKGLETRPEARNALEQLRALESSSGKITLLCHEAGPPCHRYLLLDYLAGPLSLS